jgi:predicted phage terminase large subunit-like protein
MSQYLKDAYKFNVYSVPLLNDVNDNDSCNLQSQYDAETINKLKLNNFTFQAQYQQNPIGFDDALIKREWIKYYDLKPNKYDNLAVYCDTALTENGDYSVLMLAGWINNRVYLADCAYGKWIFPELKRQLNSFYTKCKQQYKSNAISIYIENKSSGQSLIQDIELPTIELYPTITNEEKKEKRANKFQRLMEVIGLIEAGCLYIPSDAINIEWIREFLNEIETFTGEDNGFHDDFIDVMTYALKNYTKYSAKAEKWDNINESFGEY